MMNNGTFTPGKSLPHELKLQKGIEMVKGITLKSKCLKILLTTKALGCKCAGMGPEGVEKGWSLLLSLSV